MIAAIFHVFRKLLKSKNSIYDLIEDIRKQLITDSSMVLHIGAHAGVEASYYHNLNKSVFWFEANPRVFPLLQQNIGVFNNQKAFLVLLSSENNKKVLFNIASNDGHSSSILQFGTEMSHKNLTMVDSIELLTKRLDGILSTLDILPNCHWVVDVQGLELEVLKGAGSLINYAYSMEIEVSTKEEYAGGAKYQEVKDFMEEQGFTPLWSPKVHSHEDIFFIRRSSFDSR